MLVRFTVGGGGFTDVNAFNSAIYTIATAAANTTPAAPTNISSWEVLNNTVAGGWSPLTGTQSTSLVANGGTTYAGGTVGLIAPTPKTGVYKAFEFYTTATATQGYYGVTLARLSQYNGSSISATTKFGSSVGLGATASAGTNSGGCNTIYGPYVGGGLGLTFYVSAASTHIWVYCVTSGNLVGCGDLTSGSSFDYDVKSLHFPAAGLMICGGVSASTQSADNYNATVGVCNFQRGETSYDFNDVWGTNSQVISIPGITTGSYTKNMEASPFLPSVPAFGTVAADNTTYKSTWSADGYARYSVNDISLYNPWQGYPIRTIAGLKNIGWDRYNTNLPPSLQFQRVQVGSTKYMCTTFGTSGRVVLGMFEQ